MAIVLTTERLLLREFDLQDAAFVLELCNTSEWLQYIGDRGIKTLADALAYIVNGPMPSYRVNGFGLWLVALKETGKPVGMCGLIKRNSLEDVDIGYALLPQFTGRGYALEAATATLNHAMQHMYLSRIVAITSPDNNRSIALLQKLGFSYEKSVQLPPNEQEVKLFGYNADTQE